MKFLFVIDPIEKLNLETDSTVAIIDEAKKRDKKEVVNNNEAIKNILKEGFENEINNILKNKIKSYSSSSRSNIFRSSSNSSATSDILSLFFY